ncbi:MAG: 2-hydroxy-3-oxopropionate reductase [Opitutaceae bacterium]|nr:2-hydroxy-3-oxopropionate reductase [Opitutaceae bacterium]|tara:strand:+ start:3672 stop:4568 length:897 start_codon:yes stop_codon:yes gene_type:complete
MKDKRISFVGLGRMGGNMARRLKDCGYSISGVSDIDSELSKGLAEELGVTDFDSLAKVTASSDIVFTVVTNDAAMDSIFFGKDNLFSNSAGTLFINCATLSPDIHRKLESAAKENGATTLEACMASSIPQARNGELYLMIGGDEGTFNEARPLLDDMSKNLSYVGEAGKAAEVKALVNMVMNINTAALAEGLGLGQALGLDLGKLCEVFGQTGANSRVLETDAEDMLERDHECYFSSEHAAKDSGIALDLAAQHSLSLPLAKATLKQYQRMMAIGLGGYDKSGVAELTFPGRKGSESQ